MAVYKPSNCRPFLNAVDLTKDVNVQCEINTSNERITGYKLRLLNNNNEIIFEGEKYTFLKNELMGINGTILTVPLVIAEEKQGSSLRPGKEITYPRWKEVNNNSIYYIPEGVWDSNNGIYYYYFKRKKDGENFIYLDTAEGIEGFENGNANMPYKWEITLAQGQNSAESNGGSLIYSQEPNNPWAYDILVSTGQILGSTYQRIQSNLSDEIYRDYYIQLFKDGEPVNNRVRISSYDRTYGYIYPQEGFITKDDINKANRFKIYKDTNDPSVVQANRTINYVVTQKANTGNWWKAFGKNVKPTNFAIGELGNRSNDKYYYDMEVSGVTSDDFKKFNEGSINLSDIFNTPEGANISGPIVFSSTRFLFLKEGATAEFVMSKEEQDKNKYGSTFSPLNGVWVLEGAVNFTEASPPDSSSSGKCYIRWKRPSDANVWANYIGRNWFVADGFVGNGVDNFSIYNPQVNLSSNAIDRTGGIINVTPLAFFPEEAIAIYPGKIDIKGVSVDSKDATIGTIFKNSPDGSKIYIKPFDGIRNDMRMNWSDKNGATYYGNISDIDTNYWSVKLNEYETTDSSAIVTPGTQYKITSFFKGSDENPFYAYTTPELSIDIDSLDEETAFPYVPKLNNRYLKATGIYTQKEYVSWKRFRWVLFDVSLNNTQTTGNVYDGEIFCVFEGLQDEHRYQLTLEVEDEQGIIQTATEDFQVILENLSNEEAFPLEVTFDCDTQSVDINFSREGIVVPDYYSSAEHNSKQYEGTIGYEAKDNGLLELKDNNGVWTGTDKEGKMYEVKYSEESVTVPDGLTIQYENVNGIIPGNTSEIAKAKLSAPLENNITFNSKHSNIDSYFVGELFEAEINLNSELDYERVKVGALLPPDIVPASLSKPTGLIPNPARNQILINYWLEKRQELGTAWSFSGLLLPSEPVKLFNGTTGNSSNWRAPKPILCSYQNPQYVVNSNYDYLPISYYNPEDDNQTNNKTTYLKIINLDGSDKEISALPDKDDGLIYYYLNPEEANSSIAPIQLPLISLSSSGETIDKKTLEYKVKSSSGSKSYKVKKSNSESFLNYVVRNSLAIWQDEKTYLAEQIDGTKILMHAAKKKNAINGKTIFEMKKWPNDDEESEFKWDDNYGVFPYWKGEDVNKRENHTGRQDVEGKVFIFNIVLENFDPAEVTFANPAKLSAQGWVEASNGGGTK